MGEADSLRVFGFNVGESKPSGSIVTAIFGVAGAVAGGKGQAKLDAVEEYAAFKAVEQANADGIYVTRVATESTGFLFFYRQRRVTVYGRTLKLHNLGAVDQARADEWRFRNRQPNVVVIKEGETNVSLPIEVPPPQ